MSRSLPRLAVGGWVVWLTATSAAAPPEQSPAELDEEFAAATTDLVRRCTREGDEQLAALIGGWQLPAADDRQVAVAIPAAVESPASVDTEAERTIWSDFLAARRKRAAGLFAHAVEAAAAHDRQPTRDDRVRPDADAPALPQRTCEVVRLLFLTLRDDPDHERARAAVGWVRRDDRWVWPEAARRLDRGDEYDPNFGWMAKGDLARLRGGERRRGGRWVPAAEDDARLRDVKDGRQFDADHWEIVTTAPPEATGRLARELEASRLVWLQVFGGFSVEPPDLERRLAGRSRPTTRTVHSAILCGTREQYLAELRKVEPRIAIADGIYWQPTATAWFFAVPDGPPTATIHHEGFHQLFAESRAQLARLRAEPGARSGFWAVEAAAMYGESITTTPFGWTIGGRDAGRAPAARRLVAERNFHVPLAELVPLGREAFQSDARLADLYDQCGGLADFFMNARGGRYREPFVEYLVRVYSGTADPDTLPRLCRRSLAELDAEYRESMRE